MDMQTGTITFQKGSHMKLFPREQDTETSPVAALKVEGMHCSSCGLSIDDESEEVTGVRPARRRYAAP